VRETTRGLDATRVGGVSLNKKTNFRKKKKKKERTISHSLGGAVQGLRGRRRDRKKTAEKDEIFPDEVQMGRGKRTGRKWGRGSGCGDGEKKGQRDKRRESPRGAGGSRQARRGSGKGSKPNKENERKGLSKKEERCQVSKNRRQYTEKRINAGGPKKNNLHRVYPSRGKAFDDKGLNSGITKKLSRERFEGVGRGKPKGTT